MLTTFFREEHEIFRKTLRDWVGKELAPYANEWEKAEQFPREVFKKAGAMGFLGASYPEDVGGAG
ncbi:MAG TPA: acyl-CoA dehydrogenase family protein, partial [Polyangia bacterium]